MTLKDELKEKQRMAKNIRVVKSFQEIWQYILKEFQSFTVLELAEGRAACVDLELQGNKITVAKFVDEGAFEGSYNDTGKFYLSANMRANIKEEMEKVISIAKNQGIEGEVFEEDDDFCVWFFEGVFD